MKIKHLMAVSLLLAVLMMGAASASQDIADANMTADSDMEDIKETPLDGDELATSIEKENFDIDYEESVALNSNETVVKVFPPAEHNGNLTVNVGESQTPVYNEVMGEYSGFNLSDFGISSTGVYRIQANFIPDGGSPVSLLDYLLNVTAEEGYPGLDVEISDIYITPVDINDATKFVEISSDDDALKGSILIYLDNVLYYNSTFASMQTVYLEELAKKPSFSKHFVEVYFDDGTRTTLVKSRVVTMEYMLLLSRAESIALGEHKELFIAIPEDADGDLYLTFNGKTTPLSYKHARAYYVISPDGLKLNETYDVSVELRGDSYYPNQTNSIEFTVVPLINYPHIYMSVGESAKVSIDMPSTYSGTLILYKAKLNESGFFEKDGDAIALAKLVNGKASIPISGLSKGVHHFLVDYVNGNYIYEHDFSVSAENNDEEISVSVSPNAITPGQNAVVKITAPKSLAKPLDIYLDGVLYASVSILNKGQASLAIPLSAIGQHDIKVVTDEEGSYDGGVNLFYSNTFFVTVKKASEPAKKADVVKLALKKVGVKKSAKKLILQATLKINGKAVKGKIIKFKFKGKTYKAKTNKKGVAKATIKKNVLKKLKKGKKVTYTATYGKKTVKRTVKVKK